MKAETTRPSRKFLGKEREREKGRKNDPKICLFSSNYLYWFNSSCLFGSIDIDKPLDEIVDLEKIKADYAVEEMFKKNEKLYNDTEDMLR